MSRKSNLSLDDFKKWMETQNDNGESAENVQVYSKISPKKLATKITIEDGLEEDLIERFIQNGGTILESNDGLLLIEVEVGKFYLNEKYVRQD